MPYVHKVSVCGDASGTFCLEPIQFNFISIAQYHNSSCLKKLYKDK